MIRRVTVRESRFWAKVRSAKDAEMCWEWIGAKVGSGYGGFWDGQRQVQAHRWSYEQFVGPIPSGMEIDHLCRNRGCVNPRHLEPVSHRENTLRGSSFAAVNAAREKCLYGHPLNGKNETQRFCRVCRAKSNREYRARLRTRRQEDTAEVPR